MLDDAEAGTGVTVLGDDATAMLALRDSIKLGHKIALRDIAAGHAIVKFGVTIGRASRNITAGQWVHLHNCVSSFDERSQTLDVQTGAVTDTRYE
jgi:hypothetical protein